LAVLKLRNHIPISGPARREPADGTESAMRVSLGFVPAWYQRRCGVDFSERWHRDPRTRYRALETMKAELIRAFPTIPYWKLENRDDLATISGLYGAYPIPHVFGMPLEYAPDRWPDLNPQHRLGIGEIESLEPDSVLQSPVVEEILRQMELIEKEWGKIHGYLNWQGVLNNAFNLRGEEIFLDLYDRPDFAHHFFSVITEVMIRLAHSVQERQRTSGFYIDQMSVSNCVMNMISPQAYREFVFPHDREIALAFERFGVHTCNWDVTPYVEVLAELPKLGYLDMGIMSDLSRVREMFPDTRRAIMYSPVTLREGSLIEIRAEMEKIHRHLAPCDIVMADVDASTPDDRVRDFLEICSGLEKNG